MKLHYYDSVLPELPLGNFGDELNPWLWPKVMGAFLERPEFANDHLVGIGTILNEDTVPPNGNLAVFGSGAGYGKPFRPSNRWKFLCVRGPITANYLGLDEKYAVTDSALLLRSVLQPALGAASSRPAFIPHYQSNLKELEKVARDANVDFIDPTSGVEAVLSGIASAKLVLAEAMHGAIVADALRVPWIPVRTRTGINELKWEDWLLSMELQTPIHNIHFRRVSLGSKDRPNGSRLAQRLARQLASRKLSALASSGREQLSSDKVIMRKIDQLEALILQLKRLIENGDLFST